MPVGLMTLIIKLFPFYTNDLGSDGTMSWGVFPVGEAGF